MLRGMYNRIMKNCSYCSKSIQSPNSKFCSNQCQSDERYYKYIIDWKNGVVNGSRGINTRNLSRHLIRYITLKYNSRCSKCKWSKPNPYTRKVYLEIDHIDGNSENNVESNLILLCPNCHSLTSTYKNLNKGSGRAWRREKYVKMV